MDGSALLTAILLLVDVYQCEQSHQEESMQNRKRLLNGYISYME